MTALTALAAGLCGLAACGDDADAALEQPGFVSCTEDAGLSLDGSDGWGEPELSAFFLQPPALACSVDELTDDERSDLLQEAFPAYADDENRFETRVGAVTGLASLDDGDDAAVLDQAATVIDSLEWTEQADAEGAARRFVVALLEARGELPDLAEVRERSGDEEAAVLYDYGLELEQSTEPVGDRFRDLYYATLDRVG